MQAQVLVVAPIPRLAEEVQRVITEQFQEQSGRFAVVEADLREAEALVARGGTEGCEVVVSRGGTAELLERLLDIPVVHIQVSLTDILRAVRAAGETGTAHRIGVSGFPNMIYGCAELSISRSSGTPPRTSCPSRSSRSRSTTRRRRRKSCAPRQQRAWT